MRSKNHILLSVFFIISPAIVFAAEPEVSGLQGEQGAANDDDVVRRGVARALPFLEQDGVAWMTDRACLSCHHIPFLLWTHHAARAKGLMIDAAKLSEWDRWARKDSLSRRNAYKLSKSAWETLDPSSVADSMRQKLLPMVDQGFVDEASFSAKLAQILDETEFKAIQSMLLATAKLSDYSADRSGGGLDVLGQLLLAHQDVTDDPDSKAFRAGLRDMIQRMQLPDGTWTPGIQFASMRRWPKTAADQTTTMWAAMALLESDPVTSPAIAGAANYLTQQRAQPDNTEWLATRLLYEHRLGTTEASRNSRDHLLAAQKSDGGWSWELAGESDPYTTGLTLYVLAKVEESDHLLQISNARHYLLTTQQPDGSWVTPAKNISNTTVPERLQARGEIYHYWGTAWAVLGLLETLPPR